MSLDRPAADLSNLQVAHESVRSDTNIHNFQSDSPLPLRPIEMESQMIEVNTAAVQTSFNGSHGNHKRRRMDDPYFDDVTMISPGKSSQHNIHHECRNFMPGKRFIHVRHSGYVYQSEEWKPRGATMYLPLTEDIMINTHNIDQISFETDQFFLADEKGNYVGAKPGHAMHLWRYNINEKKIYISRSILFIREQDHRDLRYQLEFL